MALSGAPSFFFDAVAIFASAEGVKPLLKNSAAIDWVRDAFGHLKVIGHSAAAQPLFAKAGIGDDLDDGVIELDTRASIGQDIDAAKQQRVWDREARLALPDTSQDLGTQETTSVRADFLVELREFEPMAIAGEISSYSSFRQ